MVEKEYLLQCILDVKAPAERDRGNDPSYECGESLCFFFFFLRAGKCFTLERACCSGSDSRNRRAYLYFAVLCSHRDAFVETGKTPFVVKASARQDCWAAKRRAFRETGGRRTTSAWMDERHSSEIVFCRGTQPPLEERSPCHICNYRPPTHDNPGILSIDTLSLGGLTTTATFGEMSKRALHGCLTVDGIMGMGLSSSGDEQNIFEDLVDVSAPGTETPPSEYTLSWRKNARSFRRFMCCCCFLCSPADGCALEFSLCFLLLLSTACVVFQAADLYSASPVSQRALCRDDMIRVQDKACLLLFFPGPPRAVPSLYDPVIEEIGRAHV